MEERKLEIIQQLMEELQGLMEPGADELGDRLGRPKIEVAVESAEDMPMDDEPLEGDMEDPLAKRIAKLRG